MELDKKIKVKKIFDCFSDFEEVKKYFNKTVKIFLIWNAIQIK